MMSNAGCVAASRRFAVEEKKVRGLWQKLQIICLDGPFYRRELYAECRLGEARSSMTTSFSD